MPFDLSTEIDPAKLAALLAIPSPRIGEIVEISWHGGTLTEYYASRDYNTITGYSGLDAYGITDLKIKFEKNQFLDIPRTSDISDDSIDLNFLDVDRTVAALFRDHYGEGTRVTVLEWFPEVDLLNEVFWGHLEAPDSQDAFHFKIKASVGFRSPQVNLPHRTQYPGCQAIFGGQVRADGSYLFDTLAKVAENDCPYNRHVGGSIGVSGFTSCPRNTLSVCIERLAEPTGQNTYLAFDFNAGLSSVGGGDHKWTAETRGNQNAQNEVLRVVAGEVNVKDLNLQAFQSQSGGSNPQDGYLPSLWALCEGPIDNAYDFEVNGQYIQQNHLILSRGALRQQRVPYPTTTINYSGTAMVRLDAGPKDWRGTQADDLKASASIRGLNNIRAYTDETTYTEGFSNDRAWWLFRMLYDVRWGYGMDRSRMVVQDFIDLSSWTNDTVTTTDTDGTTPLSSQRSTFNADLNKNTLKEQITNVCRGGRFGLPFNYRGKLRVVALANTIPDGSFPTFTDQGSGRNIIYEGGKSSLTWSKKSDRDVINHIEVTFDNAAYRGWPQHKIIMDDLDQQMKAGIAFGDRSPRQVSGEFTAFGITNYGEAVRWTRLLLDLGEFDGFEKPGIKNNIRVKFKTYSWLADAMRLHQYRVIRVINSYLQEELAEPGMPWQWFRVMKMRRLKNMMVEIEAQGYPNNYYGHTEDLTFTGSTPTPNPGGDGSSRVAPVRAVIMSRTLDRLVITTEPGN